MNPTINSDEAARELTSLWQLVIERLGDEAAHGAGHVTFEITPKGVPMVSVRDARYFRDGELLVAARERGGRVEYVLLDEDGDSETIAAPGNDPGLN